MSNHFTLRFWCFIPLQHCKAKGNRGEHLVMSNPTFGSAVEKSTSYFSELEPTWSSPT